MVDDTSCDVRLTFINLESYIPIPQQSDASSDTGFVTPRA